MDTCDVLIVGGGPAGSTCAWQLRRHGLDVLVIDKASFPRDKVCAGWITPPVVDELELDVATYRARHTFQPITGFRVGLIGRDRSVDVDYDRPVSYAVRRCEFDEYLLRRSGARLRDGERVAAIERRGGRWIVNGAVSAPLLVGAGGHGCPVARTTNPGAARTPVVQAEEIEFEEASGDAATDARADRPEFYLLPDFSGYGWYVRKQAYVNVGFGRLGSRALDREARDFVAFLQGTGRIRRPLPARCRAHAYLLAPNHRPRLAGDGFVLVGDAAGLAAPPSGEGIRTAIESALMAARVIVDAKGDYAAARLRPYAEQIERRFGTGRLGRLAARAARTRGSARVLQRLIATHWFTRRVLLDAWFLRRGSAERRAHRTHARP